MTNLINRDYYKLGGNINVNMTIFINVIKHHIYRDIPMPLVSSGVEHGNLRELALARMKDLGTHCRDVRTREVGIQEIHNKVRPYEVIQYTDNLGCII